MGHQAVAEQCKAIDEWRAEIGKAKQEPKPASTAALEAKIEALCRERMEQAYRDISGALTACKAATWGWNGSFCPNNEARNFSTELVAPSAANCQSIHEVQQQSTRIVCTAPAAEPYGACT